jgi:hypothetical protein
MSSRATFRDILRAVASRNIQVLEYEARIAFDLARACPEKAAAFRMLETEALEQVFRILAWKAGTTTSNTADDWVLGHGATAINERKSKTYAAKKQ